MYFVPCYYSMILIHSHIFSIESKVSHQLSNQGLSEVVLPTTATVVEVQDDLNHPPVIKTKLETTSTDDRCFSPRLVSTPLLPHLIVCHNRLTTFRHQQSGHRKQEQIHHCRLTCNTFLPMPSTHLSNKCPQAKAHMECRSTHTLRDSGVPMQLRR